MRDNRSFVFVYKRKCEFRVLKRPTEIWLHVIPYDGGYVMRFLVLEKRGDGPLCLCPCFQEQGNCLNIPAEHRRVERRGPILGEKDSVRQVRAHSYHRSAWLAS